MPDRLHFLCVGCRIEIRCEDASVLSCLRSNFAAMEAARGDPDSIYEIGVDPPSSLRLSRKGSDFATRPKSLGELVYLLESDLVVQLQLRRPELLFLHAAALESDGSAHLLVGRSGAGKSTTCWGLLHHGFRYLSDEMAPIIMDAMGILPYAHALCMKRDPPSAYPVPDTAWRTSRGIHVPVPPETLCRLSEPPPLKSICFVQYNPALQQPEVHAVGRAESAARLYPNMLNALAHGNDGLAAAATVASQTPAFRLEAADLRDTCRAIQDRIPRL